MEERRLFYVACTRARQRLVVTAVASPDDDGRAAVAVPRRARASHERHLLGRPVAAAVDGRPGGRAAPHRRRPRAARAAARRPRRAGSPGWPASASGSGRWCRSADPADLVGHPRRHPLRRAGARPADQPVTLSASALDVAAGLPGPVVPRARGRRHARASTAAQGFGHVVHALAERVAKGELSGDPAHVDELMAHVDAVWDRLDFRTPWSGSRERERGPRRAGPLRRLARHARRPHAARHRARSFAPRSTLPDGQQVAALRLRRPARGRRRRPGRRGRPQDRQVPADRSRGRRAPAARPLPVRRRERRRRRPARRRRARREPGGAELVHLRKASRGAVKTQAPAAAGARTPTAPRSSRSS